MRVNKTPKRAAPSVHTFGKPTLVTVFSHKHLTATELHAAGLHSVQKSRSRRQIQTRPRRAVGSSSPVISQVFKMGSGLSKNVSQYHIKYMVDTV